MADYPFSAWRNVRLDGFTDALHRCYPETLMKDARLAQAIIQIELAELAIDAIMQGKADEEDGDP